MGSVLHHYETLSGQRKDTKMTFEPFFLLFKLYKNVFFLNKHLDIQTSIYRMILSEMNQGRKTEVSRCC